MDCSEVQEIIDAYALGAGSSEEAAEIEAHIAECLLCWEELGKAQRTAALLALSVPMEDAPEGLEDRIMVKAAKEAADERKEGAQPFLRRLRISWATTAAGLGVAGVAALAFAGMLQAQVNDLRTENDRLVSQVAGTNQELARQVRDMTDVVKVQGGVLTTLTTGDGQSVEMKPAGEGQPASVRYTWGAGGQDGWVICQHLADPPEGMVYQVWFNQDVQSAPAVAFTPDDGDCHLSIDLRTLTIAPTGIGITLEDSAAPADSPSGWLAYAHFPTEN